jgi:chorismate synthase
MKQNTIGENFCLTLFGGSHQGFIGGVIEGCPKGIKVEMSFIEEELERRKAKEKYETTRKEKDEVVFLQGLDKGITLGNDIRFVIENKDVNKSSYNDFQGLFRPSHCDYTYFLKYKEDSLNFKDMASARNTAIYVVTGSIAKTYLKELGIEVEAEVETVGGYSYTEQKKEVEELLYKVSLDGDSVGGKIKCTVKNMQKGIGEPIFDKLSACLAKNIFSLPSVCSFELGNGIERTKRMGSDDMDNWNEDFTTKTNHTGGINAGISNGMDIVFHVGLHPIYTIEKPLKMIDSCGKIIEKKIGGRHDKCQVFRSCVVVEAITAITIMDMILINKDNNKEKIKDE